MTDAPAPDAESHAEPFDPGKPFRSRAALAAGITRKQLRGPAYRRLMHDTYVLATEPITARVRAQAALARSHPSARCSHFTLARLLGLPVPARHEEWVMVPGRKEQSDVEGLRCVRGDGGTWLYEGLSITDPSALFTQLAPHLSLVDLVVLGDALIRRKVATLASLRKHVAATRGIGAPQARAALGFVRSGVESPMETRLRMLLVLAGLPEPSINVTRVDASGRVRRYDLLYEECGVAVEYEGKGHKASDEQWEADLVRREDSARSGVHVVAVLANGIFNRPDMTIERVTTALREHGMNVPRASEGWRAHFTVKFPGENA